MGDTMQLNSPPLQSSSSSYDISRAVSEPVRDSEEFNELSDTRRELLKRLDEIMGHRPVPTPFWAVLVLSDIPMLERFVEETAKSTYMLEFCMHACSAIPLVWRQKAPEPPNSDSSNAPSNDFSNRRKKPLIDRARERDDGLCIIIDSGLCKLLRLIHTTYSRDTNPIHPSGTCWAFSGLRSALLSGIARFSKTSQTQPSNKTPSET